VYYFVPGEPPTAGLALSRERHHVEGFPDGLRLSAHQRAADPEWFGRFFARPGLGFDIDEVFGDRADAVRAAERGTVVRGELPDPPDLGYLRDTLGVLSALLDQGGLGVLDLFACRWWSPGEWAVRFVEQSSFAPADHVQVISSDDKLLRPGIWVHTRGLRKFGRPDLQIKHVIGPWRGDNPMTKAAGEVLNTLARRLCLGAVIRDGEVMPFRGTRRRGTFRLTPDDIDSKACHFGNEVLEVVDVVNGKAGPDLNLLLGELAGRGESGFP
jgi:hypothetical protein